MARRPLDRSVYGWEGADTAIEFARRNGPSTAPVAWFGWVLGIGLTILGVIGRSAVLLVIGAVLFVSMAVWFTRRQLRRRRHGGPQHPRS